MQNNPLWQYSVATYRRQGVESLLLQLQQDFAADVNMLLCCCWLGVQGQKISTEQLATLIATTASWRAECILPLRALRGYLKGDAAVEGFRQRVKALELDAESRQQAIIYQQLQQMGLVVSGEQGSSAKLAVAENLYSYNYNHSSSLPGVVWQDMAEQLIELAALVIAE